MCADGGFCTRAVTSVVCADCVCVPAHVFMYKREKILLSHSLISVISAAHSCHHGNQGGSMREREREGECKAETKGIKRLRNSSSELEIVCVREIEGKEEEDEREGERKRERQRERGLLVVE